MQFALRLVRRTMESVLRKGEVPPLPAMIPEELTKIRTGIYVAAYEYPGRKPRGRIGSYLPTKATLAEEIVHQTSRLLEVYPFTKEDLPRLIYELLLTHPPALLAMLSTFATDAGLLVRTSRGKCGISLPTPAERTSEERFREACVQGEIDPRIEDTRTYAFAIDTIREII